MSAKTEQLIQEALPIIKRNWDTINHHQVDEEILAFISMYRYGCDWEKKYAQKWIDKKLGA
ncbi:hypothetical protein [Lactiplantibacillus plantarum]|uniref:hypothetical protein n=1 Tax=Lactiplantibacillus plantarum TaxID=1590 RepID=UPI0028FC23EC|nr:hypothetical protein [Lactiplantibacillus plantarum]WNW16709.1 hypothetical protein RUO99_04855 [Lactiplantibacillus plantarum]WNW19683.1 hypothetical protein RUP00_04850 [Lactiplantibacillus plantarum]